MICMRLIYDLFMTTIELYRSISVSSLDFIIDRLQCAATVFPSHRFNARDNDREVRTENCTMVL